MTEREEFLSFWQTPIEGGCSYAEVYGALGIDVAWDAWQSSRKQALTQMGEAARAEGLTLVLTARGLHLMKLGKIKGE